MGRESDRVDSDVELGRSVLPAKPLYRPHQNTTSPAARAHTHAPPSLLRFPPPPPHAAGNAGFSAKQSRHPKLQDSSRRCTRNNLNLCPTPKFMHTLRPGAIAPFSNHRQRAHFRLNARRHGARANNAPGSSMQTVRQLLQQTARISAHDRVLPSAALP